MTASKIPLREQLSRWGDLDWLAKAASGWPGLAVLLTPLGIALVMAGLARGTCYLQNRVTIMVVIAIPTSFVTAFWLRWSPEAGFRNSYFPLVQRAEEGDPEARFQLGLLYLRGGDGIGRSTPSAIHWLSLAAEGNHALAMMELAGLLNRGIGMVRNPEQARIWVQRAADQGHEPARELLAHGDRGEDPAIPSAPVLETESLCEERPATLFERLPGWMIQAPLLVLLIVSSLVVLAFMAGVFLVLVILSWSLSVMGTTMLALMLAGMLAGFSLVLWWIRSPGMNYRRRTRRLFSRAQEEQPEAQRELALAYLEGSRGVARDSTQALWWMRRCAENGDPIAAYRLAQWMDQGIGHHRNRKGALEWLQRASEAGYGPAKVLMKRWQSGAEDTHSAEEP